jgi:hypothetical protein
MSQLKYPTLWKVYFFLSFFIYLFWLLSIPFNPEDIEFFSLLRTLVGMLSLVGLYSFIWRVEIGTPTIWKAFFAFEIITFSYAIAALITDAYVDAEVMDAFFILFYVFFALFSAPHWYALFQLAFNWKTVLN